MKQKLLLITSLLFSIFISNAQDCPTIKNSPLPADVYFIQFNIGPEATTSFDDYPDSILILASDDTDNGTYYGDTNYVTYYKGPVFVNNGDNIIEYNSPSPEPWTDVKIDPNNFTVDFGLGNSCEYIGSVLVNDKFDAPSTFSLYPNPANRNDLLSFSTSNNNPAVGIIFDVTGKISIPFNTSQKVDVSILNEGLYFVKLISDQTTIVKKLIITN